MRALILLISLFIVSSSICAQEMTGSNSASLALRASGSADYYYGNQREERQKTIEVNREKIVFHRVFMVNTARDGNEVYERALAYARMLDVNHKAGKSKKSINIPVSWSSRGGENECVEALQLHGTLLIEIKNLKTRITLKDINYVHHDKDDDRVKAVAKSDFFRKRPDCAPEKGQVELLYNCTNCQQSLKTVDAQLETQFDLFARQYQERLKKY